ncbi:hypothetical protein [Brevundimonas subvibrioides]|uniref:Uncharacterized protein n=1 Tax=Brevundimonas subvibrioides (strain ATCC 15264 / DSM 4735 / LMG 14903 / NBRC 16000 / CB 81) TaxID=633149 RepID=D9QFY4_BRESC|nr:hypothetical protein [Brevundimonas subvibrioides]ADL00698.1 conserved hypothetical protein [Brevundimonas subvibrioides ATCC 15264]
MTDAPTTAAAKPVASAASAGAPKPNRARRPKAQKPIWIVRPLTGLERVASTKGRSAIDAGKARAATERDFEIAGVHEDER